MEGGGEGNKNDVDDQVRKVDEGGEEDKNCYKDGRIVGIEEMEG